MPNDRSATLTPTTVDPADVPPTPLDPTGPGLRRTYLEDPDEAELGRAVDELALRARDSLLVFAGEEITLGGARLQQLLSARSSSFAGGLFPGVICGTRRSERGVALLAAPVRHAPVIVRDLHESPSLDHLPTLEELGSDSKWTAWVVVDGLTSGLASFLEALYDRYGDALSYLGGGAGSLSLQQAPCLVTPEGFLGHCATVTFVEAPARLGVRHGWRRLDGPFVADATAGTTIRSLNWSRPLDLYRGVVEHDQGHPLDPGDFFATSKSYPLGMLRSGHEAVVRDPIAVTEEGDLVCVGEVPQNASLDILRGDADELIAAAGEAARAARGSEDPTSCFVIDCISRVIFLDDRFPEELQAVADAFGDALAPESILGALTLGEISSHGDAYLELFNKTVVIGAFD